MVQETVQKELVIRQHSAHPAVFKTTFLKGMEVAAVRTKENCSPRRLKLKPGETGMTASDFAGLSKYLRWNVTFRILLVSGSFTATVLQLVGGGKCLSR